MEAELAFDVEAYLALIRKTDPRFAMHHIVDYELTVVDVRLHCAAIAYLT